MQRVPHSVTVFPSFTLIFACSWGSGKDLFVPEVWLKDCTQSTLGLDVSVSKVGHRCFSSEDDAPYAEQDKMASPADRLQQLEQIEKEISNALQAAGD